MGLISENCSLWTNVTVPCIMDMQLDTFLWLVPKMIPSTILLLEAVVGCQLMQLIINYLKDKPLGSQSLMDAYDRITFQTWHVTALAGFMQVSLQRIFVDAGKIIATVWMWPMYDLASVSTLVAGMSPLVQLGLVKVPWIPQQVKDKDMKRMIISFLWIPTIVMNVVCTVKGYYPPSYYDLRGQEVQYPMFIHARLMTFFGLCLATFVVARAGICLINNTN